MSRQTIPQDLLRTLCARTPASMQLNNTLLCSMGSTQSETNFNLQASIVTVCPRRRLGGAFECRVHEGVNWIQTSLGAIGSAISVLRTSTTQRQSNAGSTLQCHELLVFSPPNRWLHIYILAACGCCSSAPPYAAPAGSSKPSPSRPMYCPRTNAFRALYPSSGRVRGKLCPPL